MPYDAKEIYQKWLDDVSGWLWAGDHDKIADAMAYPQTQATTDRSMTIETREEMILNSQAYKVLLIRIGASAYHRICHHAAFAGPDSAQIVGSHTTYMVHGGTYMAEPFRSEMSLQLIDNAWKGAGIRSAVSNSKVPMFPPEHMMQQRAGLGDTAVKDISND